MTLLIAHRGRGWGFPENTLDAFSAALEGGADGIECDFRLAKDGQLFVWHDRLFRGDRAEEMTAPERRSMLCPDLEDVFELEEQWPGKYFFLEAKTLSAGEEMMRRYEPRPGVVVISALDEVVRRAEEGGWETALLEGGSVDFLRDRLPLGAHLGPSARLAGELLGEELRNSFVWTVNDMSQAEHLQEVGTWAIGSDFVRQARSVF